MEKENQITKNEILLLKNIACAAGIVLLMAASAGAQLAYSTDFDVTYNNSTGARVLGGATPDVVAEEWFGSSNGVGVAGAPGSRDLTLANGTQNRFRGCGVWLDTTGWTAGLVTVEIDVANFVDGADTTLIFQAYAATGVDAANSVSMDLHGGAAAGSDLMATGTAVISTLGSEQTIIADGTDIPFTFTYNGTDDFVALTFVQVNAPGGTAFGSADLDNLTVTIGDATAAPPAAFLAGSWGVTFPVFGGERLDAEVNGGSQLASGAQEVVDELPEVGHVITNLSYFAHSHYFTLSANSNLNVASEIHPSLVPNSDNDEIIFDVLQTFKDADKKVILYISSNYLDRSSDEVQTAWTAYYNANFNGDEYAAYENLIAGFIDQVKDYADGYWIDTRSELISDGKLDDFYAMIRSTDPGAVISGDGSYFENLEVDSDGVDDDNPEDYRIVRYTSSASDLGDFTSGHVTPLQQGAPPNSWAYEEFTIADMVEEPLLNYDGKQIVKHGWFPMRTRWHSPRLPLVFGTEQAYRFTKRITDANAAVTFASTTAEGRDDSIDGHMMPDEMAIFKVINDRLAMANVPDYEPYIRPAGAHLVGEIPVPVLLGDVNRDGVVDFLDISPFISVLSSGGFQLEADVNQDGLVNFLDISPFIAILSS